VLIVIFDVLSIVFVVYSKRRRFHLNSFKFSSRIEFSCQIDDFLWFSRVCGQALSYHDTKIFTSGFYNSMQLYIGDISTRPNWIILTENREGVNTTLYILYYIEMSICLHLFCILSRRVSTNCNASQKHVSEVVIIMIITAQSQV